MKVGDKFKIEDIGPLLVCTQVYDNGFIEVEFEGNKFLLNEKIIPNSNNEDFSE